MNHYKTHNVCSREIHFNVENNIITHVEFVGGCSGNTQGVAALIEGLDGIHCGPRPTSCPDQLARALKEYKTQQA